MLLYMFTHCLNATNQIMHVQHFVPLIYLALYVQSFEQQDYEGEPLFYTAAPPE
jgi:hypothetical protein